MGTGQSEAERREETTLVSRSELAAVTDETMKTVKKESGRGKIELTHSRTMGKRRKTFRRERKNHVKQY